MKKSKIEVEKASKADIPNIVDLWIEYMDFHGQLDKLYKRSTDAHLKFGDFIKQNIENKNSLVLTVRNDGNIIGFSLATVTYYPPVFKKQKYGVIMDLAVSEKCQRKGLGQALFIRTRDWFKAIGIDRIELRVIINNKKAADFWNKIGFKTYIETKYLEI